MKSIDLIKHIKYNRLSDEEKIIYNVLNKCYKLELDKIYFVFDNAVILYVENNERFILGNYYFMILRIFKNDKKRQLICLMMY